MLASQKFHHLFCGTSPTNKFKLISKNFIIYLTITRHDNLFLSEFERAESEKAALVASYVKKHKKKTSIWDVLEESLKKILKVYVFYLNIPLEIYLLKTLYKKGKIIKR